LETPLINSGRRFLPFLLKVPLWWWVKNSLLERVKLFQLIQRPWKAQLLAGWLKEGLVKASPGSQGDLPLIPYSFPSSSWAITFNLRKV